MRQLGLLFGLYHSPLRTMSRLLDEGSPAFGALAVLVICGLFEVGSLVAPKGAVAAVPAIISEGTESAALESESEADGGTLLAMTADVVAGGPFKTLIGLAVLYAPTLLLVATLLAPIGGFGVAFRRDFGGLITCVFFVWAAAHLPFAVAALLAPQALLFRVVAAFSFAAFLTPAVQLAIGASLGESAIAVVCGFFGLLLMPFLHILASPFLLFYAWAFLSGGLSDVEWSLKARRSQRRYLEAATLNPRDAEAHIQLGLIHVRRRQWPEARMRFERAVEIEPTDPDARYQLARLDRRDGRYPEAEKNLLAVITRDPRFSHHEVWREFGANYLDAKLYEDARQALERFVTLRAHDPEGLVYLGETLLALERPDEAKARFREAIEASDTMPHYRQREVKKWRARAAKLLRGYTRT